MFKYISIAQSIYLIINLLIFGSTLPQGLGQGSIYWYWPINSNNLPEEGEGTSGEVFIEGGTIHKYEISGGKRKFLRFIGCYLGQCNFHKNIDDAIDYIKNLKESQKIQITWNKDT